MYKGMYNSKRWESTIRPWELWVNVWFWDDVAKKILDVSHSLGLRGLKYQWTTSCWVKFCYQIRSLFRKVMWVFLSCVGPLGIIQFTTVLNFTYIFGNLACLPWAWGAILCAAFNSSYLLSTLWIFFKGGSLTLLGFCFASLESLQWKHHLSLTFLR